MKHFRLIGLLLGILLSTSLVQAQQPSPDNNDFDPTDQVRWFAQYFNNSTASGPPAATEFTSSDPTIQFQWGNGSPNPAIQTDYWSASWTRNFSVSTVSGYRFELDADDGARVFVDGQKVLDTWWGQPNVPISTDLTLQPGNHVIYVEYHDQTGNAQIRFQFFPRGNLSTDYWLTEYFNSTTEFTNPVFVHQEKAIYHDWAYNSPAPNVNADYFGVRMQRLINVEYAPAQYRFNVRGDDGVRLYVDDQLLIDGWWGQSWNPLSADITLYPGEHTIRLEYHEELGYAYLEASYFEFGEPAQAEPSHPIRMLNHAGEVMVENGVIVSAPENFPLQPYQGVPGELYATDISQRGDGGSTAPGDSPGSGGGGAGSPGYPAPGGPGPGNGVGGGRYMYRPFDDYRGAGLEVIDTWNWNAPHGFYTVGYGKDVTDIAVSGEYVYVSWTDDMFYGNPSCRGQIDVINVSDPLNPFRLTVIDNPGYAHSVFIKEGVLYTLWGCAAGEYAHNTSQLRMYDLDPFQPIQLGQYQMLLPDEFMPSYQKIVETRGYVWIPYDKDKWAVFR